MTSEQTQNKTITPQIAEMSFFDQLISQLIQLHRIIAKSSYVKRSAQILNVLIDDATQPQKVLIIGRNSERQSAFINAQLNRPLMPLIVKNTVISVSIIRYGHEEKLTAHFLDGQIASFDLSHLPLFTSEHSEGAHILQEGLDYVDVFLNEPLLKNVSLIDVPTIPTDRAIFIQPSILRRADDIYWLIEDEQLTDPEKRLLKRLNNMGFEPLAISEQPVTQLKEGFRDVKIQHIEEENEELAHQDVFQPKRISKIIDRFLHWLDRFYMEITNLLQRDPYLEARRQLEREIAQLDEGPSHDNEDFEGLKQRAQRIVKQYNKAQTIYQFVQFIKQNKFIDDESIVSFVGVGNQYLEEAHHYRKLQQRYAEVKVELETLERKSRSKLMLNLFTKEHTDKLQRVRNEEPVLREKLLDSYKRTKRLEEQVERDLPALMPRVHHFVENEVARLQQEVSKLKRQKPTGPTKRFKAVQRLKRFDALGEAQIFLNDFLASFAEPIQTYLNERQQKHLEKSTANIASLTFDYQQVIDEALKLPEQSISKYALQLEPLELYPLNLDNAFVAIEKPAL